MKKLVEVFLSLMADSICSGLFASNSDNNDNKKSSGFVGVDGIYYFNREYIYEKSNPLEKVINTESYGEMYGTSITIENNQFDMKADGFVVNYKLVKDGERYKLEIDDYQIGEDEQINAYLEYLDGVLTITSEYDGEVVVFEYLKDKSKVKKYDYRLNSKHICYVGDKNETNNAIDGWVSSIADGKCQNDFIDIDGNILINYYEGKEYRYNITKEGDEYTLTLLTETEFADYKTAILEMSENWLKISYNTEYIDGSKTYQKL